MRILKIRVDGLSAPDADYDVVYAGEIDGIADSELDGGRDVASVITDRLRDKLDAAGAGVGDVIILLRARSPQT